MSFEPTVRVVTIVRTIVRGSGFSCEVVGSDGLSYIMKLNGAGQGAAGLAVELIATRLARHLELRVPDVKPIWFDHEVPWSVGTDEFDDALQRSAGWNLGIRKISDAVDVAAQDFPDVPEVFLEKLALVDAALVNVDRTSKNPNLMIDASGHYWAIDFGACLFHLRGSLPAGMELRLPTTHCLATRGYQFAMPVLEAGVLKTLFADFPAAWNAEVPHLAAAVLKRFAKTTDQAHGDAEEQ